MQFSKFTGIHSFVVAVLAVGAYHVPLGRAVTTVSVSATASHAIPTTLCENLYITAAVG